MHGNKFSIVILCYRAGESVKDYVNRVIRNLNKNSIVNYEIILVGNYHSNQNDETPTVVKRLARGDTHILYSTLPKKGMMGWDMRTGLEKANGDYIAIIDGDGQMPANDLIRVYKTILSTEADLVKTYRFVRGDGFIRVSMSLIFNMLFCIMFPGLRCRDINSKPKIFSRSSYRKMNLTDDGWFIDAEMMIQARRLKFKIVEIPTVFRGHESNRHSFVNVGACIEFLRKMVVFRVKETFIRKKTV